MKTMSGPGAPAGSVHTASGASAVEPSVPAVDESAIALGLDADPEDANPAKRRRTSGPRLRKSRDEAFAEELERIEAKYEELMASLSDTSSGMPTAAAVAKLQRMVSTKMLEAKEHGFFQGTAKLDELASSMSAVKEALRCTGLYLPATGHPKKTQAENFLKAMEGLERNILQRFPDKVLAHFYHLSHQKDGFLGYHTCSAAESHFEGETCHVRIVSLSVDGPVICRSLFALLHERILADGSFRRVVVTGELV